MVVKEMADAGVAADQDELLGRRARAERLGQPEQALDRHVHDEFGNLLAGREMHDMAHALHGALDAVAVGNRAFHHLEPRRRGQRAIVAEGADREIRPRRRAQPPDQVRSHLSGRAGDQKLHLVLNHPRWVRRRRLSRAGARLPKATGAHDKRLAARRRVSGRFPPYPKAAWGGRGSDDK